MTDDPQGEILYCLKFTDLTTNYVWYGTANYTKAVAEDAASRLNARMAGTEVKAVPIAERFAEQQ